MLRRLAALEQRFRPRPPDLVALAEGRGIPRGHLGAYLPALEWAAANRRLKLVDLFALDDAAFEEALSRGIVQLPDPALRALVVLELATVTGRSPDDLRALPDDELTTLMEVL